MVLFTRLSSLPSRLMTCWYSRDHINLLFNAASSHASSHWVELALNKGNLLYFVWESLQMLFPLILGIRLLIIIIIIIIIIIHL